MFGLLKPHLNEPELGSYISDNLNDDQSEAKIGLLAYSMDHTIDFNTSLSKIIFFKLNK